MAASSGSSGSRSRLGRLRMCELESPLPHCSQPGGAIAMSPEQSRDASRPEEQKQSCRRRPGSGPAVVLGERGRGPQYCCA
jgi:hypothetical protein